jgi:hypothetical protein
MSEAETSEVASEKRDAPSFQDLVELCHTIHEHARAKEFPAIDALLDIKFVPIFHENELIARIRYCTDSARRSLK